MSGILLKFLPKNELLHQSLYFCRGMAKKKSQSQGTEKGKKTCNKNQFFGGCFKSEIAHLLKWFKVNGFLFLESEPFRRENKKEKSKRCRDPCKDGPCRPEK